MTDDPLRPARERLTAQRESALAQAAALSRDLAAIFAATESVATDDEHDPEGATIAFERAQLTSLIEASRARAAELDQALARLGTPGYGVCAGCGAAIGAERLAARPAATTCIACAR